MKDFFKNINMDLLFFICGVFMTLVSFLWMSTIQLDTWQYYIGALIVVEYFLMTIYAYCKYEKIW